MSVLVEYILNSKFIILNCLLTSHFLFPISNPLKDRMSSSPKFLEAVKEKICGVLCAVK